MLRLVIDNTDVELYENESVNLRFQYADIESINNPLGSYSQTFRVPLTETNRRVFGNIDEASVVGTDDLRKKIDADLYSASIPIFRGFVQIKRIYLTKENYAEVELAFFSATLDLKTEISGLHLSDIDFSNVDHDLTWGSIQATWANLSPAPTIRYFLMDKGQNWSSTAYPGTEDDPMPISQYTMAVQAKAIFERMMDDAGFTYESNFIDGTHFAKMYVPAWAGGTEIKSAEERNENIRVAKADGVQNITVGNSADISMGESEENCFDQGDNWNGTVYTAPVDGIYNVRITYSWDASFQAGGDTAFLLRFMLGTSTYYQESIPWTANKDNNVLEFNNLLLESGTTVKMNWFNVNIGGTVVIRAVGSGDFLSGVGTNMQIDLVSAVGDFEVDVARNLPKMLQVDFLTSLQRMFNLVIVPDRNRPNHLIVEPFDDYLSSGDQYDWTNKVDYGMDVVLYPTTDIQSQQYEWSHSPGTDFTNDNIQKSLDRVYGRLQVNDSENDFATGNLKLESKFAPFIPTKIPGINFVMFRGITANGEGLEDPMPMLAFWNGLQSGGSYVVIDEDLR